jgi:hypothetical protein
LALGVWGSRLDPDEELEKEYNTRWSLVFPLLEKFKNIHNGKYWRNRKGFFCLLIEYFHEIHQEVI